MKDVIEFIRPLVDNKTQFVLATVLKTWGSAPRKQGAHMVIARDGSIAGSVSGGCVEGDVSNLAAKCMEEHRAEVIHYGVADEDAWTVGLSCGGKIDVFLQPFFSGDDHDADAAFWSSVLSAIDRAKPAVLYFPVSADTSGRHLYTPGSAHGWKNEVIAQALRERRHLYRDEPEPSFFEVLAPKSKLILFGASHIAADLVHFASQLNFETIVIDPRRFFSEGTSFPTSPDRIIHEWPAEALPDIRLDHFTYAVTLTHDPKIDDQALHHLLPSDVAYIGALGSRKTHEKRKKRLTEAGFNEAEISRIHGPVGVDIHAQTAQEIALSIISEIIGAKNAYL